MKLQKKKTGVFVAGILLCMTLAGCMADKDGSQGVEVEIYPLDEEESRGLDEDQLPSGQEHNTGNEEMQGAAEGYMRGRRIEAQTFDVTLRPVGQVTFASYEPDTAENPLADVVFQIERGNEVLYQLQGTGEGNIGLEMFDQVEAVSFLDYNKDNYDDIIIIISYYFGAGPQAAQTHSVIRYYNGTGEGNFVYQKEMSEDASLALTEITVQIAKEFIGAGGGTDIEAWQQAFITYLENDSKTESNEGYTLITMNTDGIPQLVEAGMDEATGCRIVCYADGKIHVNQTSRLYFSYIPGENLLCNSEGNMDHYYDLVYRLSGGKMELIAAGYYGAEDNSRVQFDEEGNPVYQYEWNGVRVSEEEYQRELSKVYDSSKAATYDYGNLYSADEIKKIIEDY